MVGCSLNSAALAQLLCLASSLTGSELAPAEVDDTASASEVADGGAAWEGVASP